MALLTPYARFGSNFAPYSRKGSRTTQHIGRKNLPKRDTRNLTGRLAVPLWAPPRNAALASDARTGHSLYGDGHGLLQGVHHFWNRSLSIAGHGDGDLATNTKHTRLAPRRESDAAADGVVNVTSALPPPSGRQLIGLRGPHHPHVAERTKGPRLPPPTPHPLDNSARTHHGKIPNTFSSIID